VLHHNPIESIEVAEVLTSIAALGHRVQALTAR
jgi:hypothetical protein